MCNLGLAFTNSSKRMSIKLWEPSRDSAWLTKCRSLSVNFGERFWPHWTNSCGRLKKTFVSIFVSDTQREREAGPLVGFFKVTWFLRMLNDCNPKRIDIVSFFLRAIVNECIWLVKTSSVPSTIIKYVYMRNTLFWDVGRQGCRRRIWQAWMQSSGVRSTPTYHSQKFSAFADGHGRLPHVEPRFDWRLSYSRDEISWFESLEAITETFQGGLDFHL